MTARQKRILFSFQKSQKEKTENKENEKSQDRKFIKTVWEKGDKQKSLRPKSENYKKSLTHAKP